MPRSHLKYFQDSILESQWDSQKDIDSYDCYFHFNIAISNFFFHTSFC